MRNLFLRLVKVLALAWGRHCLLILIVLLAASMPDEACAADEYINSAHGDSGYGVDRADTQLDGYSDGNCSHCHEAHASISIAGSVGEPDPVSGSPSMYLLFYAAVTRSNTDNFCVKCHDGTTTVAQAAITNLSYSERAGGWAADTVDDVLQSFTTGGTPTIVSVHDLDDAAGNKDISTYITGQWGYTANSNPCAACHNPHKAQGDPENSGAAKSSGARGYPLARPSQHNDGTWDNWGDDAGEKTSDYTASYKAPLRMDSATVYEPDGSATFDGTNLTDINTFCLDCHVNEVPSNTSSLGLAPNNGSVSPTTSGYLTAIDWNDRHGQTGGTTTGMKSPYSNNTNYVLACTDCHEGHGSRSVVLIRGEVNDGNSSTAWQPIDVTTMLGTNADSITGQPIAQGKTNKEWVELCTNCHDNVLAQDPTVHVHPNFVAPDVGGCSSNTCHYGPNTYQPCGKCHYHGSTGYYYDPEGANSWQTWAGGNLF